MNLIRRKALLPLAAAFMVTACGGGGGGDDSPPGNGSPGGGTPPPAGTTKTRIVTGAISGFGSVIVNGVRYDTSSAQVRIEDRPGAMSELSVGQVVRIEAEVDDRGGARARTVEQHRLVQGTVQAVDAAGGTLTIAGQVIRIDDDTSFDDSIAQGSLAGIAVGERIEVHGFPGASGQARATRVERAEAGEVEVEVTGVIAALDTVARRFRVGTLVVDYSAATLEDFGATGPRDGDLVEVKGREFLADGALRAQSVDKEDDDRGQAGNEAEIEGLVTRLVSAADFDVAGRPVRATASTVYVAGAATDLRLNAKVEAEGALDASGVLVATKIAFKRASSLRLAARVEAVDSAAGTVRALGITIVVNPSTRVEDKEGDDQFFALGDLRVSDWIEVRGYADPAGAARIIATRLERDEPEDEVELRGPASDLQAPRFRIFGVGIETTPATEFEDEDVRIDATTFFARAGGQLVEVDGSWNGTSLTARKAEIEREDDMTGVAPPVTPPPVAPPVTPPPVTPPPVTPPPVTPPPTGLDGAALYAANCGSCHGPINAIRLLPASNRNVADIQRAIGNNKGGMGFLSTLTVQQLQAIVDAMQAANP
jgi:hypothetical protein